MEESHNHLLELGTGIEGSLDLLHEMMRWNGKWLLEMDVVML